MVARGPAPPLGVHPDSHPRCLHPSRVGCYMPSASWGAPPRNEGTFFPSLLSCPSRAHMGQETSHSGLTGYLDSDFSLGLWKDPPNPVSSVLFLKLPGIKLGVCVCVL